jgi:nucleoside-diphosphate-sugar epimerase
MTKGEQVRDFVHVEDVAKHFVHEVEEISKNENTPVFTTKNVGSGNPQSIFEFASHWWEHWNAKGKLLPGTMDYRDNEVMRYVPKI